MDNLALTGSSNKLCGQKWSMGGTLASTGRIEGWCGMQLKAVKISNLEGAPWRLTDEKPCRETKNVVASLNQRRQLRPILVRPLDGDRYQIIEGHVVVDAAREAGWMELDCIVHEVDEPEALLIYLHLKLNRTGENHVK